MENTKEKFADLYCKCPELMIKEKCVKIWKHIIGAIVEMEVKLESVHMVIFFVHIVEQKII